ncbi:phosphotransferase enzyme family protein [Alkalinema pantanalense CENA528]|uniref:phosphotransferase enzyme family protein n=1 Tax=Alkalinema pantanalense TaxID=1620705 RepID=UPI003D6DD12F
MVVAVFPVIYSTLACDALSDLVLSRYAIAPIQSCEFWHRGLSDIYVVETLDSQYVLRVSHNHWRSRAEINFELEFLDFLHGQRFPIAYPLRTIEGQLSVEIQAPEGPRYASLFIYAPGQVPLGDLNTTQGQNLGATVAKLHHTSLAFQPSGQPKVLDLNYLLDHSVAAIEPFLPADDRACLLDASARIHQQLQNYSRESPYWVVCWGDAHSGNAHFTSDTQMTLFDFDQCGYSWRSFEIAKFLKTALTAGTSRSIRQAFLAGYQSVQPLEPFELEAIRSLTQMAFIWSWAISLTHARWNNYCRLDDYYFHQRLEQLKMFRSNDCYLF